MINKPLIRPAISGGNTWPRGYLGWLAVILEDSSGCLNHVQHKCNLLVANCDDLRSCNLGVVWIADAKWNSQFSDIFFLYFVCLCLDCCVRGVNGFDVWGKVSKKNLVINLELFVFLSTWRRETEGTNVEPNSHSSPEAHVADVRGVSL